MPLMMTGTPARPGITISKPPPAKAAVVVAIKIASVTRTRIARRPDFSASSAKAFPRLDRGWIPVLQAEYAPLKKLLSNLIERARPRVKAADQTAGKPNA